MCSRKRNDGAYARIAARAAFALLAACASAALSAQALPPLGAIGMPLTVSGVSSGGYMAVQVHVAHSARVRGAGILAGGPYYCAQGSLAVARYNCTRPGSLAPMPRAEYLKSLADGFAAAGQIDPTTSLAGSRVWLFSGKEDRTVHAEVVKGLADWYALHGVKAVLVADRPAGHAMLTETFGNRCASTEPPYINDCDYDAAGELLRHLLGPLEPPRKEAGRLLRFAQDEFAQGDARAIGMAAEGFAYIPSGCGQGECRVHVAFHGCRQNVEAVGERFVREAGYNRWAEANRLVVLYPQTAERYFPLFNPRGCWDWWGYTGPQYATKAALQIQAVMRMLERLAVRP